MSDTRDRILGTLYGQAIGDALGLPAEFKSPNAIRELQKNWGNWPNAYAATGRSQYGWVGFPSLSTYPAYTLEYCHAFSTFWAWEMGAEG